MKTWFQNRRMKHKKQLRKLGEDKTSQLNKPITSVNTGIAPGEWVKFCY